MPRSQDNSEWLLRKQRIDPLLDSLGWKLAGPRTSARRLEEYDTDHGPASMVKHAADDEQPLLTAAERVQRAFDNLTAGKTFTPAQQSWFDRIREHLVQNLSIDREDFDDLPVFTPYGRWTKADRDFAGKLTRLLEQINEAVAA